MRQDHGPIFPIPVPFKKNGKIDYFFLEKYLEYLFNCGVSNVLTTSGTSSFSLLSSSEIIELNHFVYKNFSNRVILGVPFLNQFELGSMLSKLNNMAPNAEIMIQYSDKVTPTISIKKFFKWASSSIAGNFHFHGLPMKSGGNTGFINFDSVLINDVRLECKNLIGMKEEHTTYEEGFKFCANLSKDTEFEIIVAGGSMRRFWLLKLAGAQSFLTGIGSIFPEVEVAFYNYLIKNKYLEAEIILKELEVPLFDCFMRIGWHASLRFALINEKIFPPFQKFPMEAPTKSEQLTIINTLNRVKETINILTKKGIL